MKTKKNTKKNNEFHWNVWVWSFNHDTLECYDVVPMLLSELEFLKKKELPKTKDEFSEFMRRMAQYHFWAKCEYEMVIHSWPEQKNDKKVDVYDQLMLNWDLFIDAFWDNLPKKFNSSHRKRRGGTAPNRALRK